MTKYSVLMSLYIKEKPEYLRLAVESMLNQSIPPDEIVIVKDGPITDELRAVLDRYHNLYKGLFNIVGYEENMGLGHALNFGLKYCRNELVARMDTDDVSRINRCEEELKLFEMNPDLDIVGSDISEFTDDDLSKVTGVRSVPRTDKEIKRYMKTRCPYNHMTVIFKKTSVQKAGGYKDLFWNEDYWLWIRMAENDAKMANTGTVLVDVRTGKDMYRRRGGRKYFESEKFLQKYMLERKMINRVTYFDNVLKRRIVQLALPVGVRGWVFRRFARNG